MSVCTRWVGTWSCLFEQAAGRPEYGFWVWRSRGGWSTHLPAAGRQPTLTAPQECSLLVCLSWTLLSPLPDIMLGVGGATLKESSL